MKRSKDTERLDWILKELSTYETVRRVNFCTIKTRQAIDAAMRRERREAGR